MSYAQNRQVSGRVTSATDGSPISGASVSVVGTSTATQTDGSGSYSISVSNSSVLSFSYIGYENRRVTVGNQAVINVQLVDESETLEEVVVTGQGLGIEKKRLSTTVDVITAKDLESVPNVRLDQLLQAKLPSAQIKLTSGAPGTASQFRSRGYVSANSSSTPVIYVDGVRVDNLNSNAALFNDTGGANSSAISDIPAESIERIEFIKGGAATTLYGSDAANGVLQIFTKKGSTGSNAITFETQLGAVKGTTDFLRYSQTGDILFRTGLLQSYRLGLTGGNDKTSYNFSGNIYDNGGYSKVSGEKRYSLRTNLSTKVSDKLTYDGSFAFISSSFNRDHNANSSFGLFGGLESGGYGNLSEMTAEETADVRESIHGILPLVRNDENIKRFQSSHALTYKPVENLALKATLGFDNRQSLQKAIASNAYLIALGFEAPGTDDQGYIDQYNRDFLGLTGDFNAQHKAEAGDFSFISTLGGQVFRNTDNQIELNAKNVTEGSLLLKNSAEVTGEDFQRIVVNYGMYVAENIGFKDKLFLELGLRLDGNSAFGDNVGLQAYPKVGLAYDLGSEQFFQNWMPNREISLVKFRLNYGKSGLFPTPFANVRTIASNAYLSSPSFTLSIPGDDDLRPEKMSTYEGGIDLGLFGNRANFSATYYQSTTKDALFNAPFSPSTGLPNQLRNLGEISNRGWELATNLRVLEQQDFQLNANASLNILSENKVLSTGGAPEFSTGGFAFLGGFVKEDFPVGFLRGSMPTFDADGNLESVENNAFLGNPTPKNWGSFGLTFTYKKRLSLSTNLDYQTGGSIVNLDEVLRFFSGYQDDRIPENALPAAEANFTQFGGVWVEKSDYLKFRNISVSYQIPAQYLGRAIKGAEIGFMAINPINFYASKIDGEIDGSGGPASQGGVFPGGFGYGTESAPRQFLGSLRLKF